MLWYCLTCREKTDSWNARTANTNKGKLIILSNCVVCDNIIWNFIKEQEASGLLSNLGITTPLSKISLVGLV